MKTSWIVLALVCFLVSIPLSHADEKGGSPSGELRFGYLNLLPDEIAILHVSTFPGDPKRYSGPCDVRVSFLAADGDPLGGGDFVIEPGKGLDVGFTHPVVCQFRPVIQPLGACNVDIVPLLQIQEQVPTGTGKTLYIYTGQPSVLIRKLR